MPKITYRPRSAPHGRKRARQPGRDPLGAPIGLCCTLWLTSAAMSLVLASEGQERADHVVVGEMVSRDTVVAGVVEHLPRGAGAALARVPGVALDPFERLV